MSTTEMAAYIRLRSTSILTVWMMMQPDVREKNEGMVQGRINELAELALTFSLEMEMRALFPLCRDDGQVYTADQPFTLPIPDGWRANS